MIIVNTDKVPGKETVECFGLVRGSTIRAKWIGKDIIAGLRMIVGGEMPEYTEMLAEAREQALARMVEEAEGLGANAIVNIRFTTSQIMSSAAEMLAYGTAVRVK